MKLITVSTFYSPKEISSSKFDKHNQLVHASIKITGYATSNKTQVNHYEDWIMRLTMIAIKTNLICNFVPNPMQEWRTLQLTDGYYC